MKTIHIQRAFKNSITQNDLCIFALSTMMTAFSLMSCPSNLQRSKAWVKKSMNSSDLFVPELKRLKLHPCESIREVIVQDPLALLEEMNFPPLLDTQEQFWQVLREKEVSSMLITRYFFSSNIQNSLKNLSCFFSS